MWDCGSGCRAVSLGRPAGAAAWEGWRWHWHRDPAEPAGSTARVAPHCYPHPRPGPGWRQCQRRQRSPCDTSGPSADASARVHVWSCQEEAGCPYTFTFGHTHELSLPLVREGDRARGAAGGRLQSVVNMGTNCVMAVSMRCLAHCRPACSPHFLLPCSLSVCLPVSPCALSISPLLPSFLCCSRPSLSLFLSLAFLPLCLPCNAPSAGGDVGNLFQKKKSGAERWNPS